MRTSASPHTIDLIYFPLLYRSLGQQNLQRVCLCTPFWSGQRFMTVLAKNVGAAAEGVLQLDNKKIRYPRKEAGL